MRFGPPIPLLRVLGVDVGPERPLWLVGAILGLLPPKMGSKTVIRVGYPAQLMFPDGPRSLVVTRRRHHSHSFIFWVFFGLLL